MWPTCRRCSSQVRPSLHILNYISIYTSPAGLLTYPLFLYVEPGFFQQFNLVIASNVADPHLTQLATVCGAYTVPLIAVRSCGLAGYVRLQVTAHEVVESRPESEAPDLRLSRPFPALAALAQRCDLASLDSLEHSHVPYPLLLIKALQLWKSQVCLVFHFYMPSQSLMTCHNVPFCLFFYLFIFSEATVYPRAAQTKKPSATWCAP